MVTTGIPKVFIDAFAEKPVIHTVGNPAKAPYGCPDLVEINDDGSQTHYFSSSCQSIGLPFDRKDASKRGGIYA